MAEGLGEEDSTEVALVAELAEHAGGGAAKRIGEVGGVAQVDHQCQTVHHDEEPLAEAMIGAGFLLVEREQHQHDVEGVGIDDSGRVEDQSSVEEPKQMGRLQTVLEMPDVHQQIGHASDEINHIGQQQVPQQCRHWCKHRVENAEACRAMLISSHLFSF